MAVLENVEGEDAPAPVPAPPDLLSLDKLTLFDDMELEDAGELHSLNPTQSVSPQHANMMNLLRIAIYNISYIRGLFPEENFRDSSVPELEMTIKKLIPKDIECRRLIDWIDQGVYDAMEKKYLETVYFSICEKDKGGIIDEYSFTFRYPNQSCEETVMEFSLSGSKGNGDIFMSNSTESTGDQIRRLIRFSAKMMSSLDQIPDERTILMKLMYYDDVTPKDYEPPLFECFPDDEDDTNLVQSFGRLCVISQRAPVFLLDSGATHHICCDKSYLTDMRKISKDERIKLNTANSVNVMAKEAGEVAIGNIHINQIRYIPGLTFNLISIGYLDKQGLLISIVNSQFVIIDVSKSIHVGEGHRSRKNNDYILKAMRWKVQDEVELPQESRDGDDDADDADDDATESWVIDSGCASHMAGKLGMLTNARFCCKEFYTPRGSMLSTHKGSVMNANVKLSDVSYCPDNRNNLLSVGVLDSQGYRFTFYNGLCTIVCKDTLEEVGWGMLNDSNLLYYLQRLETKDAISKKKWKR